MLAGGKEMRKKILITALLLTVIVCCMSLFAACDKDTEIVITLNENYDNGSTMTVVVNQDGSFDLGEDPKRDGFRFDGWFTDSECTVPFDKDKVEASLTLYAKWLDLSQYAVITVDVLGDEQQQYVLKGESFTLPQCEVSVDGKVFDVYISDGTNYAEGQSVTVEGDMTFTAQFVDAYSVTVDCNGGFGDTTTSKVKRGDSFTLPAAPLHTTKTFASWMDQYGVEYQPGEVVTAINEDYTFTAMWQGAVKVSYNLNQGESETALPDNNYETGDTFIVTDVVPERVGYLFDGWSDGRNVYSAGDEYTVGSRDVVLTAQWKKSGTIVFHDNTVMRDEEDIVVYVELGGKVSPVTPADRPDYTFGGWFIDPECTRQWIFEVETVDGVVDLYAKWSHNYLRFTAVDNGNAYVVAGPSYDEVRNGQFDRSMLLQLPQSLTLPTTYEGKPVTGIKSDSEAMRYLCTDENHYLLGASPLKEIIIPASYTSVADKAFYWCKSLTSIKFEENSQCTYIGREAFYSVEGIDEIVLPSSVTQIGHSAFLFASGIKSIDLSQVKVTVIEKLTFAYMDSLETIIFPDTLERIEKKAFYEDNKVAQLNFPATLTYIGNYAFSNGSGDSTRLLQNDGDYWEHYESVRDEQGNYYEDWTNTQSCLENIFIPKAVTFIGDGAFAWAKNAKTLVFEDGGPNLTHIGAYAFYACKSLTTITLPTGLTFLGGAIEYDEDGNPYNVEVLYEYNEYGQATDVIQAYGNTFRLCESLTSIVIPEAIDWMFPNMFRDCKSLTSVTFLSEEMDFNASRGAFRGCSSLETFEIPASVTVIGDYTFMDCTSLQTVTFETGSQLINIFAGVFRNCSSLTSISLPNSVQGIAGEAFYGCSSLTEITLPESVTSIGTHFSMVNSSNGTMAYGYVFAYSGITSLYIPKNVSYISPLAFAEMHELLTFTMDDDCRATSFWSDSRYVGGGYTFYNSDKLQEINLCKDFGFSFPTVGLPFPTGAFIGCDSLVAINASPNSSLYQTVEGVLYSKFEQSNVLVAYPQGIKDATYEVVAEINGVPTGQILNMAFSFNENIRNIVIPASVKTVSAQAFYMTTNLETVVFEEGSALTSVGQYAFAGCTTFPRDDAGNMLPNLQPLKTPLKYVVINTAVPPQMALVSTDQYTHHAFTYSTENPEFAIYVPDESVETYKTASGWSLLADFIKPVSQLNV